MNPIEPQPGVRQPPSKKKVVGVLGGTSAAAIALALAVTGLKPDEGKRNVTYLDIAHLPTYCYGHMDRSAKVGAYHDDRACEALLTQDAKVKLEAVEKCVPALKDRSYQLAAATRLAFNIGEGKFCKSSIARNFNAGNWKAGCNGFAVWKLVNSRVIPGLVERRKRETLQCMTGL